MEKIAWAEEMRLKWKNRLTGDEKTADPAIAGRALEWMKAMVSNEEAEKNAGNGQDLWPDLNLLEKSAHVTTAFRRIREIAQAYQTAAAVDTYQNSDVYRAAHTALMRMRQYYRKGFIFGNWWDYDIGGPQALCDCLILLYDEILGESEGRTLFEHFMEAVHDYIPVPWHVKRPGMDDLPMTGANLTDVCLVIALRGIMEQNEAELQAAREGALSVLPYVDQSDGFYVDGSFIQHQRIPYAGAYGMVLLTSFENVVYLLTDTCFSITEEPDYAHVSGWILDSYLPLLRNGAVMDMVRGRAISRCYSRSHAGARDMMAQMLLLSEYLPEETRAVVRREIKGQMLRNTWLGREQFWQKLNARQCEAVKELLEDESTEAAVQEESYHMYGCMDRLVVHRKEYGLGVSMFSERVGRFSFGNGENKKGYHTSEGMIYLYTDDQGYYDNEFWPTVDEMRLPGITTDHTAAELVAWKDNSNSRSWVGGSSLLNRYGSTGMEVELEQPDSDLTARKSWFMFENGMVCLGAGIHATTGDFVETIVENRKVESESACLVSDTEEYTLNPENNWEKTVETDWMVLETGFLPIGYYFPQKTPTQVKWENREGCWKDLNDGGTEDVQERSYVSIGIVHGTAPEDASYSYVLAPGKNREEMKRFAENKSFRVLTNTRVVQAAMEQETGLFGMNFWEAGEFAGIRADGPCSVTGRREDGQIRLGISEPTHHSERLTVTVDGEYEVVRENGYCGTDEEIMKVIREAGRTCIELLVKEHVGRTETLVLRKN